MPVPLAKEFQQAFERRVFDSDVPEFSVGLQMRMLKKQAAVEIRHCAEQFVCGFVALVGAQGETLEEQRAEKFPIIVQAVFAAMIEFVLQIFRVTAEKTFLLDEINEHEPV